jgi:hypothetical protein
MKAERTSDDHATSVTSSTAASAEDDVASPLVAVRRGRQVCPHLHSAHGCAMGSHCPHAHVGLRTDTAGSAAKAMAEMSRMRDAATSAQQPVPVWLFRENSCRQGGVQWRRVGPEHSATLEAAFGENPSNADVRLSGTYSASFAQMMLFNRSDRGERRPLQRVLLAAAPQWFAIPEDTEPGAADVELRHFAASAAEMLEHCYVTALRSHFGLLAFEEAAWVNLHRMQLTVLRTGARYRLHRQVVAAMPGGPPSDLYRHPLLQSASFITSATDGTAVIQCRPTDHRVGTDSRHTATRLTQLGEPVALQLEDIVPGCARRRAGARASSASTAATRRIYARRGTSARWGGVRTASSASAYRRPPTPSGVEPPTASSSIRPGRTRRTRWCRVVATSPSWRWRSMRGRTACGGRAKPSPAYTTAQRTEVN